jgi:hypothetical protein
MEYTFFIIIQLHIHVNGRVVVKFVCWGLQNVIIRTQVCVLWELNLGGWIVHSLT